MAEKDSTTPLLIIGGLGAAAWYFWPQISAAFSSSTTTTTTSGSSTTPAATVPAATFTPPVQTTNSSPISITTPGAIPVGQDGCYFYAGAISCPAGVAAPPTTAPVTTAPLPAFTPIVHAPAAPTGYTAVTGGFTFTPPATGNAPAAPVTLTPPSTTAAPANPHPKGGSLSGLRGIAAAAPINSTILQSASHNPQTAAIVAGDPRAHLTVAQWNYFYTQASGQLQTSPTAPADAPGMLITAPQYQAARRRAGLPVKLSGISNGPSRNAFIAKGNRTIYRVPGRGAVLAGIENGGGNHRWARSPFPRPAGWREAQ